MSWNAGKYITKSVHAFVNDLQEAFDLFLLIVELH